MQAAFPTPGLTWVCRGGAHWCGAQGLPEHWLLPLEEQALLAGCMRARMERHNPGRVKPEFMWRRGNRFCRSPRALPRPPHGSFCLRCGHSLSSFSPASPQVPERRGPHGLRALRRGCLPVPHAASEASVSCTKPQWRDLVLELSCVLPKASISTDFSRFS